MRTKECIWHESKAGVWCDVLLKRQRVCIRWQTALSVYLSMWTDARGNSVLVSPYIELLLYLESRKIRGEKNPLEMTPAVLCSGQFTPSLCCDDLSAFILHSFPLLLSFLFLSIFLPHLNFFRFHVHFSFRNLISSSIGQRGCRSDFLSFCQRAFIFFYSLRKVSHIICLLRD